MHIWIIKEKIIAISTYPQSLGVQRDNYYVALRMVMGTY
jgi:hypothetical protein